jgi:hypothetical protein
MSGAKAIAVVEAQVMPPGPERAGAIRKLHHAPDTYKYPFQRAQTARIGQGSVGEYLTGINVRVRSEDYSISACYRAAMREALFR